jgi:hypothetical protein
MYFGNHDFYYITLISLSLHHTSEALHLLSSSSKNRVFVLEIVLIGKSS